VGTSSRGLLLRARAGCQVGTFVSGTAVERLWRRLLVLGATSRASATPSRRVPTGSLRGVGPAGLVRAYRLSHAAAHSRPHGIRSARSASAHDVRRWVTRITKTRSASSTAPSTRDQLRGHADVYSQGSPSRSSARPRRDGGPGRARHKCMPRWRQPQRSGQLARWIIRECEASLRRLQTDWIDLYQIHRPDPTCDIDETLGALTDLQRAGKIRAFGSSTFPRRRSSRPVGRRAPGPGALRLRAAAVLASVRASRPRCCPSARIRHGGHPWSPLAGGFLSGAYHPTRADQSPGQPDARPLRPDAPRQPRKMVAVDALTKVAGEAASASSTSPSPSSSATRR